MNLLSTTTTILGLRGFFLPYAIVNLTWFSRRSAWYCVLAILLGLLAVQIWRRWLPLRADRLRFLPQQLPRVFDGLTEGLLIVNKQGVIVFANDVFARSVGIAPTELCGSGASSLPWLTCDGEIRSSDYPWEKAVSHGVATRGVMLTLLDKDKFRWSFRVNCTPLPGFTGKCQGVAISLSDITTHVESQRQLTGLLEVLERSRAEIRRQNQTLQTIATKDALTACLNRRSFFEQFEVHWSAAERYAHPLSCLMVDIDRFKTINDEHGHHAGDRVLRRVAACLRDETRDCDLVCRHDGEVFCVLLPHIDIDEASRCAERHRQNVSNLTFADLTVTVSVGVAATGFGADSPHGLVEQAVRCLDVAKLDGRNQVVRWDAISGRDVPDDTVLPATPCGPTCV